ncbi:stage V sporulation protein AC [Christensenellaceae bacterium OttesenSCG-928-M15]|nr:stage V sporulation protein AC [Christensenellaceae bacterium OttesenSCG-928-M15]
MEQIGQKRQYEKLVSERAPKSDTLPMLLKAYLVGGIICCIGQAIRDVGENVLQIPEENLSAFTGILLIFIGATLTGIGVYDKIGKFAGAGSVVPITGFANSIVSPAMEHRCEGIVLGVAANLFSIAGPVLVYGVVSSMIVGLLHLLLL